MAGKFQVQVVAGARGLTILLKNGVKIAEKSCKKGAKLAGKSCKKGAKLAGKSCKKGAKLFGKSCKKGWHKVKHLKKSSAPVAVEA